MTLIDCPECNSNVSDLAIACPCCGFPVAAVIKQAVVDVTDGARTMSVRQQQAVAKLKVWGERYQHPEAARDLSSADDTFLDRHWRPIMVVFVAIIVILQLIWAFSLFG